MTGPEHYREAERHLSAASYTHGPGGDPVHPKSAAHHLGMAQVHALLAAASATAMSGRRQEGMHSADFNAWDEVAGVPVADGGTA